MNNDETNEKRNKGEWHNETNREAQNRLKDKNDSNVKKRRTLMVEMFYKIFNLRIDTMIWNFQYKKTDYNLRLVAWLDVGVWLEGRERI